MIKTLKRRISCSPVLGVFVNCVTGEERDYLVKRAHMLLFQA